MARAKATYEAALTKESRRSKGSREEMLNRALSSDIIDGQIEMELPTSSVTASTIAETAAAHELHSRIVTAAEALGSALMVYCRALRDMRDGKHYKALGCATFEEYAESVLGISRTHAYRHAAIADKLESAQLPAGSIGIKKLELLASAPEDIRAELAQNDIENTATAELKEQIDRMKAEAAARERELELLRETEERIRTELMEAQAREPEQIPPSDDDIKALAEEYVAAERERAQVEIERAKIAAQEQVNKLSAEIKRIEEKASKPAAELNALKQELSEQKKLAAKAQAEAEASEKEKERLAAADAELRKERETLERKLKAAADADYMTFKVKFNLMQNVVTEVVTQLSTLAPDTKEKCTKELSVFFGGLQL